MMPLVGRPTLLFFMQRKTYVGATATYQAQEIGHHLEMEILVPGDF